MFARIFNNPFTAFIFAIPILIAVWIMSLFPSDYKVGLLIQISGTAVFLAALMVVIVWLVWRIRTVYRRTEYIDDEISPDTKGLMVSRVYQSVAIVLLAAAVLCVG